MADPEILGDSTQLLAPLTHRHGVMFVFSSSTLFEPERAFSKFAAWATLEHGGDFSTAVRVLRSWKKRSA